MIGCRQWWPIWCAVRCVRNWRGRHSSGDRGKGGDRIHSDRVETSADPVQLGLVASLSRPGGNVTGVTQLNVEVAPKRLEFLHELIPGATSFALLVNPTDPAFTESALREMESTAHKLGLQLHVLRASDEREFDEVFGNVSKLGARVRRRRSSQYDCEGKGRRSEGYN